MPNRPTAAQLDRVLAILTNARDAALIDKVAMELGLAHAGDGLNFLRHMQSAAQVVGADFLPVQLSTAAADDDSPDTMGR